MNAGKAGCSDRRMTLARSGGSRRTRRSIMHSKAVRVIHENRPYLVVRGDGGSVEHAYGPFTPGTEPSLADCTPDREVSGELVGTLVQLLPASPPIPPEEDTLAGS